MFIVEAPVTPIDFDKYFQLRFAVLREPWKQPLGSEKDDLENYATHAIIKISSEVVAVGRMHISDKNIGIIRYMAVHPAFRGSGLGNKVLRYLESEARKKNLKTIELNARENAVEFYIKNGYSNMGSSHVLYDEIQHFLMRKPL